MPPVKKPKNKPSPKAVTEATETTPVISGQLKKKLQLREKREKPKRGVVFIKHLPHGFFEDQIRRYFEQFGDVTRLRLARSKITGGSRGFAFVEFDVPEVAEVAAETMDNYLMFNKVVKATYIPPDQQLYNFFKTSVRKVKNKAGKPIYVSHKTADINRRVKKFNEWSDEAYQKRTALKQKRIKKLEEKYADLGIDFSSITVGSKEADETKAAVKGVEKPENKTGKRKTKSSEEQTVKKSKKQIQLEDLLGTTLDDDSDDHDFELDSENESDDDEETTPASKKRRNEEEVSLEDLLGETLNDDSDDSEYELETDDDEVNEQVNMSLDEEPEEEDEAEESSDEEEEQQPKKTKPANKKNKKDKKSNVNSLEKMIQHKKLEGGIKKAKKDLLKKPKFGKPKNAMHTALTKELAQPMPSLKKSSKNKKQKK